VEDRAKKAEKKESKRITRRDLEEKAILDEAVLKI